jgi:hypothetical protein
VFGGYRISRAASTPDIAVEYCRIGICPATSKLCGLLDLAGLSGSAGLDGMDRKVETNCSRRSAHGTGGSVHYRTAVSGSTRPDCVGYRVGEPVLGGDVARCSCVFQCRPGPGLPNWVFRRVAPAYRRFGIVLTDPS